MKYSPLFETAALLNILSVVCIAYYPEFAAAAGNSSRRGYRWSLPIKPNKTFNDSNNYKVKYKLYNINCILGVPITYTKNASNASWNTGEVTVFVIHGWLQSGEVDPLIAGVFQSSLNIKDAYIESNKTENIIIVNWELVSNGLDYISIARDSYLVGASVANMVVFLKNQNKFNFTQVKFVGFGLGAHVAGVAGYYVTQKVQEKVSEITGLDPVGPLFDSSKDQYRLDKSDALFVQIIHCSMGNANNFRFGSTNVAGHVDFYPNGGSQQPNCTSAMKPIVSLCSHMRCSELYASTVRGVSYEGCTYGKVDKYNKEEDEECVPINGTCRCAGPPLGYLCPPTATGEYRMTAIIPIVYDKPKNVAMTRRG